MNRWIGTTLCHVVVWALATHGGERKTMDLYLLIGQSNMAGRGKVEEQDRKPHPQVFTLNKEKAWVPAVDPIHFDKSIAGVGPGRAFGIAMAEHDPEARIGLVPCAVGGTSITAWVPGVEHAKSKKHLYDDMLARLKVAQESGTVKGILWHQGESDGKRTSQYMERLAALIAALREELGNPGLPFVAGLVEMDDRDGKEPRAINGILLKLPEVVPNTAVASSEGLTTQDGTHFDSASQRELGKRFAEKMIELQEKK
ncbi:Carbohydrate acetyl esterase/feruloyl esterase [Pontiella desulfatans]|uniref:Carbohydrate acetyl esterase/feruloyl esterase n=1 Tax=Pontiella desulfatans TaxID=2750659 RepID=A0A6C2TW83_PONDE|nr:sialate O-acetylesterase [Pontiella desulfatans]VGO11764.1 Carbohydrate acetyl esterase/feruloyl esterase [Pontiella desulfatans]